MVRNVGTRLHDNAFLGKIVQKLNEHWIEAVFVSLIFCLGFGFYLWFYFRFPLMLMIDGPYYLIQVQSLLQSGTLVYGDPPLTFFLLTITTLLYGDIIVGVKVGIAFFCALTAIPAYFLMKRVGKSMLAGYLAMLFIIFSPLYLRMISDFIKNAIGIAWLLAFIYFLHDLTFSGYNRGSLGLATIFLLLTGLTHILVFGVAILFLLLYTVLGILRSQNRKAVLQTMSVLGVVIVVFVLIAATFFSWFFSDFSKVFSFLNTLTESQNNSVSQPPIAGPGGPVINNFFALSLVGGWGAILVLLSIGTILSLYVWKKHEKEALVLLVAVTIIGAILSFPLIPTEYLTRFMLMLTIPAAVILSYGLTLLWRQDLPAAKVLTIILIVLCVGIYVAQSFQTAMSLQPTISFVAYQDLVNMRAFIGPNSVIVISNQQGIGYWIQYVENTDIVGLGQQLSADLWQSYSHVYGIFVQGQLPPGNYSILFEGNVYILVELYPKPSIIQYAATSITF
ncbi:MAG: hypothetical protein ACFFCH_02995 [Promethearchaeota archaeon]